jgi:3-hydroxyisobutyrate dehydrogenase-like beta-hydroxyacid dehydrogenase
MNIGFIGLGTMGSSMASNVLKAGYSLKVYDMRPEAAKPLTANGAVWAESPQALAKECDIILTSLPGPKEVEEIILGKNGILEVMRPGSVYVDLSTNSPTLLRRIYSAFKEKGCDVLDSPVSGGPMGAKTGKLALMVGGDEPVFKKCKPVLDSMGNNVLYTGKIGSGNICKLMNNCMIFGITGVVGECLSAGVKAGVDPEVLWQAIMVSSAGKGLVFSDAVPNAYLKGAFEPRFALNLAFKDVTLGTLVGRDFNVPMPLSEFVRQDYMAAVNRGWGNRDFTVSLLLQEERAGGVEVRIPEKK